MDEWIHGEKNWYMYGWIGGVMNDEWIMNDAWMHGWIVNDAWMHGWMNDYRKYYMDSYVLEELSSICILTTFKFF